VGRESCPNAKAKYSSSVVPPDPSVHFYHCGCFTIVHSALEALRLCAIYYKRAIDTDIDELSGPRTETNEQVVLLHANTNELLLRAATIICSHVMSTCD